MDGINDKVKQLRISLGENRQQFGARFSVGYNTVRDWEQGRLPLGLKRLVQIGMLSDPPLCWHFLKEAGITLEEILRKIQKDHFGLYRKRKTPKEKRKPLGV